MSNITDIIKLSKEQTWVMRFFYKNAFFPIPLSQNKEFMDKIDVAKKHIQELCDFGFLKACPYLLQYGLGQYSRSSFLWYNLTEFGNNYCREKFSDVLQENISIENWKHIESEEQEKEIRLAEWKLMEVLSGCLGQK